MQQDIKQKIKIKMKSILAAVDFSEVTPKIIKYSALLAEKFNYKIYVVHVAAPDPDFVGYEPGPQVVRDIRAEELTEEHKKLFFIKEDLISRGLEVEALLVQGKTVEEIINQSKKYNAEFIVLGSRDHGALHKVFRGSNLDSVISESEIPVLVVPQNKDQD